MDSQKFVEAAGTLKPVDPSVVGELSRELLEKGAQVKLRLSGLSMFPAIRPKDIVLVEPLVEKLMVGEVVFFRDASDRLVLHRIVASQTQNGQSLWVAKGDGWTSRQDIVSAGQILGVVRFVERKGRRRPIGRSRPPWSSRIYAFIYYYALKLWHALKLNG